MNARIYIFSLLLATLSISSCKQAKNDYDSKIIFLHHSTGNIIWNGGPPSFISQIFEKVSGQSANRSDAILPSLFLEYNNTHQKNYLIEEKYFPKAKPYGWNNFPFDYYNIWVKHSGDEAYMEEPTLEILTKEYQVIVFKHCFPVCYIKPDLDSADINSEAKTLANYKLQYNALKTKMHEYPNTKFILFTGAAQVKSNISAEAASRAQSFFNWVREDWDQPDDNIYLWDLYGLQTEGDLFFKEEFAASSNDSHPNEKFAKKVSKLLFNRIIDVIENNASKTSITGEDR